MVGVQGCTSGRTLPYAVTLGLVEAGMRRNEGLNIDYAENMKMSSPVSCRGDFLGLGTGAVVLAPRCDRVIVHYSEDIW